MKPNSPSTPPATRSTSTAPTSPPKHAVSSSTSAASTRASSAGAASPPGATAKAPTGSKSPTTTPTATSSASKTATSPLAPNLASASRKEPAAPSTTSPSSTSSRKTNPSTSPKAPLLKPNDLQPLLTLNSKLLTQFHMYPDRDLPGERLFLQLQALLPNLTHHHLPPDCKDYSDLYLQLHPPTTMNPAP